MSVSTNLAKLIVIPGLIDIKLIGAILQLNQEELTGLEILIDKTIHLPTTMTLDEKIELIAKKIDQWVDNDSRKSTQLNQSPLKQRVQSFCERLDLSVILSDGLHLTELAQSLKDMYYIAITTLDLIKHLDASKAINASKAVAVRSGGTIINLIQHMMLANMGHVAKAVSSAGLFAGWAVLKEMAFNEAKEIKEAALAKATSAAEKNCFDLLRMLQVIENYYPRKIG